LVVLSVLTLALVVACDDDPTPADLVNDFMRIVAGADGVAISIQDRERLTGAMSDEAMHAIGDPASRTFVDDFTQVAGVRAGLPHSPLASNVSSRRGTKSM